MLIELVIRALADPTRLRVLRLLDHMELAVGELAQVLGQSQPRVSRHIGILCDAGLVERRPEGSWVFLRLSYRDEKAGELGRALAHMLSCAEAEDKAFGRICHEDHANLTAIRAARSAAAEAFFARHADEWDELRTLHSPDGLVEEALLAALGTAHLGKALDIGTGTGRMVAVLAPHAEKITALDKSLDMLRVARANLQTLPADCFELVHGDFLQLPFTAASFDLALLHHVLHFSHEPAQVLAEAARVLVRGGRLAIVDFAAHDREDFRERYAHARLGFSDADMAAMLGAAGCTSAPPMTLDGGPLALKIWIAEKT